MGCAEDPQVLQDLVHVFASGRDALGCGGQALRGPPDAHVAVGIRVQAGREGARQGAEEQGEGDAVVRVAGLKLEQQVDGCLVFQAVVGSSSCSRASMAICPARATATRSAGPLTAP
ncbi:hypothetical protein [Streptomyces chartreusis]|uniref:hypothetical protein n=1 Tax=Streptomyces chartreusis TaxID=1969 RepID=UPI0036CB9A22